MKQFRGNFSWLISIVGIATLFFLARQNYLLFFSAAHLLFAAIGIAFFLLTLSLRDIFESSLFRILGLGYGFVGSLTLLHVLSLLGLSVIGGGSVTLEKLLEIVTRTFEAGILFAGIFLQQRRFSFAAILTTLTISFFALIALKLITSFIKFCQI